MEMLSRGKYLNSPLAARLVVLREILLKSAALKEIEEGEYG